MKVRAKFTCHSVTKRKGWGGHEFMYDAGFQPVCDGSDENKRFFSSTPSGEIKLTSILPDAFEPGKSYYIDFIPADA